MNQCDVCQNSFLDYAGPIWLGKIHDNVFVNQLINNLNCNKEDNFSQNEDKQKSVNGYKINIDFK